MKKGYSILLLVVLLIGIVLILSACQSGSPGNFIDQNVLAPLRSLSDSITRAFQGFRFNFR